MALKKHKRATVALGTIVEFSIWLPSQDDSSAAFKCAYEAINTVHQHMSVHDKSSDLGRYRLAKSGEEILISDHTANVLQFSEQLWQESSGLFDVCIGHTLAQASYLPHNWSINQQFISRKQSLNVAFKGNEYTVQKIANTMIDLGGVAKGYAVDLAILALQKLNVPAALVNAGGDMRMYGEINVPIHLRQLDEQGEIHFHHIIDLHNQALASSGMPINSGGNPHVLPIVNPITQQCLPISTCMKTILADTAMVADALTKLAWLNHLDYAVLAKYNARLINS